MATTQTAASDTARAEPAAAISGFPTSPKAGRKRKWNAQRPRRGGRRWAGLASATAVLVVGLGLAGCTTTDSSSNSLSNGDPAPSTDSSSNSPSNGDPAPSTDSSSNSPSNGDPAPSTASSTCFPWGGLSTLQNVDLPLHVMAGDVLIYPPGSLQLSSDQLPLLDAEHVLNDNLLSLPTQYGWAVQNNVISVLLRATSETNQQLNDAARNAETLAAQIRGICYNEP